MQIAVDVGQIFDNIIIYIRKNLIWSDDGIGRDREAQKQAFWASGAEGASKNSQAKGPVLDDTLESKISANFAPTKQSHIIGRGDDLSENISGKIQRQ